MPPEDELEKEKDEDLEDAIEYARASTEALRLNKKWYLSKTFWFNVVWAAELLIRAYYGFTLPLEGEVGIVTACNLILRVFTKEALIK